MPVIRPSSDLRNKYNEISTICHKTNKPIYITKNGAGDLAVMSIELYETLVERYETENKFDKDFNKAVEAQKERNKAIYSTVGTIEELDLDDTEIDQIQGEETKTVHEILDDIKTETKTDFNAKNNYNKKESTGTLKEVSEEITVLQGVGSVNNKSNENTEKEKVTDVLEETTNLENDTTEGIFGETPMETLTETGTELGTTSENKDPGTVYDKGTEIEKGVETEETTNLENDTTDGIFGGTPTETLTELGTTSENKEVGTVYDGEVVVEKEEDTQVTNQGTENEIFKKIDIVTEPETTQVENNGTEKVYRVLREVQIPTVQENTSMDKQEAETADEILREIEPVIEEKKVAADTIFKKIDTGFNNVNKKQYANNIYGVEKNRETHNKHINKQKYNYNPTNTVFKKIDTGVENIGKGVVESAHEILKEVEPKTKPIEKQKTGGTNMVFREIDTSVKPVNKHEKNITQEVVKKPETTVKSIEGKDIYNTEWIFEDLDKMLEDIQL